MLDLRELIVELYKESLETTDSELIGELNDDTVLLESGLDSLGFAILVARLEEELNYDPFTTIYKKYQPQ